MVGAANPPPPAWGPTLVVLMLSVGLIVNQNVDGPRRFSLHLVAGCRVQRGTQEAMSRDPAGVRKKMIWLKRVGRGRAEGGEVHEPQCRASWGLGRYGGIRKAHGASEPDDPHTQQSS